MRRVVRFILVLALVGACRDGTGPIPVGAIAGTWSPVRQQSDPPGSSETISLGILPTLPPGLPAGQAQLEGDGSWTGEAGPSGTSTATGWLKADSVMLDFTYYYGAQFGGGVSHTAHFAGRLTDATTMMGTVTVPNAGSATVTYRKLVFE